jgi:tetratricopeptide (TPR) repeat protein
MEAAPDAVSSELPPPDQDTPLPAETAPSEPSSAETPLEELDTVLTAGDVSAAEDDHVPPPAPETVHAWLAQIKAPAILALLREPDFAYVSMNAFAGYRVNPTNYALPMVRGRLVREAVKNDKFAEKLLALAEAAAALPPPNPEVSTPPSPPASDVSATPPPPTDRELLRAERERAKTLRVERDGARLALADAQTAREHGAEAQHQAEAARADAERHAGELEKEAARLKRRVERLKDEALQIGAERDTLRKSLKQALSEPRPAAGDHPPERRRPETHPASTLWQDAAMHLLHRRRYDLALLLAEEVLRLDARNVPALDMAAQVYEARNQAALAAPYVRALLEQAITDGRLADAADAWQRGLRLPSPAEPEKSLRALLRALRPEDAAGVRQMRVALSRLQGMAPQTHSIVVEQITRLASPALAEALMPPPGALTPDDPLPLGLPLALTARAILDAIDAGDDLLVAEAREAWARLAPGSDDAERVRIVLERTAGDDPSVLQPLLRVPRGPVLVDASNVALHGQEMLARPRPRLRALQSMRSALLRRGWFPVFTIADANLPHHIDEPDALADLRARRVVRLVDSGTQADEALLREAKRLSAPLVTNDYMTDWDPQAAVTKIRYTFSHTGDVWFDQ